MSSFLRFAGLHNLHLQQLRLAQTDTFDMSALEELFQMNI